MAISLSESLHIGVADILMRKVRSVVTIMGIVLGVMCIMVVLALLSGMNKSTMDWMQERGGLSKVEISRNWEYDFRSGGEAVFSLSELRQIQSLIPEAKAFNPTISTWDATMKYQDYSYNTPCLGVLPDMQIVENWYPAQGRFINEVDVRENNNVIVLGSTAARELFRNKNPLGKSLMMKDQMMTVIGVLSEKYWENPGGGGFGGANAMEYMNRRAFIPLSTMMYKISPGSQISQVEIIAQDPQAALELQKKLQPIVLNIFNVITSTSEDQIDP